MWLRRWFDWVFVTGRRREARKRIVGRSAWQTSCLANARGWMNLAEYASQVASLEGDFSLERLDLLRWSCLWALAWDTGGPGARESLVPSPPSAAITAAVGGPTRWEALRQLLLRTPFDDASLPAEQTTADRRALASFASDLIAARDRPERELARATGAAGVRASAVVFASAILGLALYFVAFRERLGPNLAEGRTWKTSSTMAVCDPVHATCAGAVTTIFFHTQEEESPWAEVDLGDRKAIKRIEVQNRIDCCQERAVPLVAEVSDDEAAWREVARQDTAFVDWTARFAPTQARYVRLRAPRKTILHLESIVVQ